MPGGKCVFNKSWLEKAEYKKWLMQDDDRYKAKCSVCNKAFNVSGMGESAVKLHMNGKSNFFSSLLILFLNNHIFFRCLPL